MSEADIVVAGAKVCASAGPATVVELTSGGVVIMPSSPPWLRSGGSLGLTYGFLSVSRSNQLQPPTCRNSLFIMFFEVHVTFINFI
jgi:hypothetical protein